jgi:hypothetical protein
MSRRLTLFLRIDSEYLCFHCLDVLMNTKLIGFAFLSLQALLSLCYLASSNINLLINYVGFATWVRLESS